MTELIYLLERYQVGASLLILALVIVCVRRLLSKRQVILVDGSNVLHWANNNPDLRSLRKVIELLKTSGYHPEVVFDANVGYLIFDRWSGPQMIAPHIGLSAADLTVVPKGTTADQELLRRAQKRRLRIVTNDSYRDWIEAYPFLRKRNVLVHGRVGLTGATLDLAPARKSSARPFAASPRRADRAGRR